MLFRSIRHLAKRGDHKDRAYASALITQSLECLGSRSLISLTEVSALSALESIGDMLSLRSGCASHGLLGLAVSEPRLFEFYGNYQVHYYGGVEECIDNIARYARTSSAPNGVFVAQTILSLLAIRSRLEHRLDADIRSTVRDKVYAHLSPETLNQVETLSLSLGFRDSGA